MIGTLLTVFLIGCSAQTLSETNPQTSIDVTSRSSSNEIVKVEKVTILKSEETFDLQLGEVKPFNYRVFPENATNQNVTISIDNTDVIQLQEDKQSIKALKKGEAHITVKSIDGNFSDTVTVSVYGDQIDKTRMRYTYIDYCKNVKGNYISCPCLGEPKLLIVPLWFTDSSNYITSDIAKRNVREDIETAWIGTASETGWHSVSSYYQEESNDQCVLDATVTEWYEVGLSSDDFKGNEGYWRTHNLPNEVVDWYFTAHPEDSKENYDTNIDGVLDGIVIIYGAPDYFANGDPAYNNMWAYCSHVNTEKVKTSYKDPIPCSYFWASYDFMYGPERAERRAGSRYNCGDTRNCLLDSHSYIHEMAHVMGIEDYYDYGPNGICASGAFSMQDQDVGGHDPYSVMAYGWTRPFIPTESSEIVLHSFQESKELILLTPEWNDISSPFDEYLLVELFTNTGLNELDCKYRYAGYDAQGPEDIGIRLWHVDARLSQYKAATGYSKDLTCDPTKLNIHHAFSNSFDNDSTALGKEYDDYCLLQMIRNDTNESYKPKSHLKSEHLFKQGDTFSMDKYGSQFINKSLLNSEKELGWEFTVERINTKGSVSARIKCTKI